MNGVIDFDDRQECYRKIIDRFEMVDYSDFRSFENSTSNSLKSCSNRINKNLVSCLFCYFFFLILKELNICTKQI